jgi:Glycosyltransferase family 9 (heptosyltransferase)
MKKFAIIPGKGLGDLMILAGMAYNLSKKYKVQIYHPLMQRLQYLMPYVEAFDRPLNLQDMSLKDVDAGFITFEQSSYFEHIYPQLKNHFGEKFKALNPCVTEKKDYRFVEEFFFNVRKSFTQNLIDYALKYYLDEAKTKDSGIQNDSIKDPHLIILHVTASKSSKSWKAQRFKHLKKSLEKRGYTVKYATLPHEISACDLGMYSGIKTLEELIEEVSKAAIVIGNESGICHLASALNVPSVVLCRNARIQRFWGADYKGKAYPMFPPRYLINVKGFRLRDKYWQFFIFKKAVLKKVLNALKHETNQN